MTNTEQGLIFSFEKTLNVITLSCSKVKSETEEVLLLWGFLAFFAEVFNSNENRFSKEVLVPELNSNEHIFIEYNNIFYW